MRASAALATQLNDFASECIHDRHAARCGRDGGHTRRGRGRPGRAAIATGGVRRALVCVSPQRPGTARGAGDWLSGRAPRSHRGGHWFDPSIAHQKLQVRLRRQGPLSPPMYRPLARRAEPRQGRPGRAQAPEGLRPSRRPSYWTSWEETDQGVRSSRSYTVAKAVDEWLAGPMGDRAPKTVATQREILEPLTDIIGQIALRDLAADDISKSLIKIGATRSTRTVRDTRAALVRVITYAQARGKVGPECGRAHQGPAGEGPGRPSKALTVSQALAVLKAAQDGRI